MRSRLNISVTTLSVIMSLTFINSALPQKATEQSAFGLKPQLVADFIFSVIEADRTLYARQVVQRMQNSRTIIASETWMHRNALPLPSQMLTMAGKRVEANGLGLTYRLASLSPIYEKNRPTTDFERRGLEAIRQHPEKPYTGIVMKDQKPYFQAIYSDRAVTKACVNCHNAHVLSPKRDYQLHDVMGGVIISFPLK
ncbi:MAG: Tll0287-like domain-containing protein [Nitrospirales bacterium]